MAGTPGYFAPEMAAGEGHHLDERTDVYLLGATLHECITGERRHGHANLMDAIMGSLNCEPIDYGPDVPEAKDCDSHSQLPCFTPIRSMYPGSLESEPGFLSFMSAIRPRTRAP